MSRTHKTKPVWVQMKQGHLAHEEWHQHDGGVCDLPEKDSEDGWRWRRGGCCREFVYTGTHTCGPSCCGDSYSHPPAKLQRLESKRLEKNWNWDYETKDPYFDYYFEENHYWDN